MHFAPKYKDVDSEKKWIHDVYYNDINIQRLVTQNKPDCLLESVVGVYTFLHKLFWIKKIQLNRSDRKEVSEK